VFDLEQARDRLNFERGTILVDGQRINSFDELVQLSARPEYRDRDVIEVVGVLPIAGG